jgi:chaperonin GroES
MAKKTTATPKPAPRPVAGRVVIVAEKVDEVTPGGIVLPEQASDRPQTGVVVAVDPKRTAEKTHVQVNDRVLYSPYASVVKVDGEEFVIMPETDILAVL